MFRERSLQLTFRDRPGSNSTEQTVGELEERLGWNPDLLLLPMLLPLFCLDFASNFIFTKEARSK